MRPPSGLSLSRLQSPSGNSPSRLVRPEVVRARVFNTNIDDLTLGQIARDENETVNFGSVPLRASDTDRLGVSSAIFQFAAALDQYG